MGMIEDSHQEFRIPLGAKASSACYLLVRKGEVVYVGQSVSVFNRLTSHINTYNRHARGLRPYSNNGKWEKKPVAFDEVVIIPCAKDDLDKLEQSLIQKHLPAQNVKMRRPAPRPELLDVPAIQQLLLKGRERKAQEKTKELKRRSLPRNAAQVEREFREYRDPQMKITIPVLPSLFKTEYVVDAS